MNKEKFFMKKTIYILSVLMSLWIVPSFAADTVVRKLTVTPTEAQIGTAQSKTFSVTGGEEPYIWKVIGKGSLDIDSGNTVKYTAAKSSGEDRLLVMDNKGVTAEVNITVNGTLLITPENAVLPPNGTKLFSVSGEVGKVQFTATKGTITASGEYTAPAELGVYTITATDEAENKATVQVSVKNSPIIIPAQAWVDRDGKIKLDVVGGKSPFAWHTTAGTIDVEGSSVEFTAPSESITATVTVTDNLGETSQAEVFVDIPLRATKEVTCVQPGEKVRVAVTGGLSPFEWQVGNGQMETVRTEDVDYNYYTAPQIMGEDIINIRDRKNNETEVKVYVTEAIKVTPNVRYMKRGETKSFTIVGGVPPYTVIVVDGNGTLAPDISEDGRFTYTAGNVADKDIIIEVSDNCGQTVQIDVYVERKLRLTCVCGCFISGSVLYANKGTSIKFKISAGYFVETDSGFAEIDENTGIVTYELANRYGESTLTVIDSSGQTKDFIIKLERLPPVIVPSTVTIAAGETKIFMVTRGVAPYEWTFEGGLVEAQNESKSVVKVTIPKTAGTYQLTVEDSAGYIAEATTVNVFEPLLISPNSYMVSQGENVTVRFDKKGGAGKCDWALADLQEVEKTDEYIVVRPSTDVEVGTTYSVFCRDQNSDIAQANIIVVPPTDKAQIEFEGLKEFYKVGETLSVDLVQKLQTNSFQVVDLWAMIQMPNGQMIYRTPLALAPFSFKPQAFKKSLEKSSKRQKILDFEIPAGLDGTYVLYAVYVKEGSNLQEDGITVQRSNMVKKKTTLAHQ
jgi:hypothetical protein